MVKDLPANSSAVRVVSEPERLKEEKEARELEEKLAVRCDPHLF